MVRRYYSTKVTMKYRTEECSPVVSCEAPFRVAEWRQTLAVVLLYTVRMKSLTIKWHIL